MSLKKIPLLILAAGKSTRMGFPKGLLEYRGQKLLNYQIRSFLKMGGEEIVVVLGEHKEKYLKEISSLADCEILFNEHVERGPFSSLQLGIEHLKDKQSLFLLPLDTPSPSPSVWRRLAKGAKDKEKVILPLFKEHGGHPLLIQQSFFSTLLSVDPLSEEGRLDKQIAKLNQDEKRRVEVQDLKIRLNVNTLNDIQKASKS